MTGKGVFNERHDIVDRFSCHDIVDKRVINVFGGKMFLLLSRSMISNDRQRNTSRVSLHTLFEGSDGNVPGNNPDQFSVVKRSFLRFNGKSTDDPQEDVVSL